MKFLEYSHFSLYTFSIFERFPDVRAFISTRKNESKGLTTDTSSGESDTAEQRRTHWLQSLGIKPDEVAGVQQVHSNRIIYVRRPGFTKEADAQITDRKDLYLRVDTADCLPVFLYDKQTGVVGLVHAGWRGLKQNIVQRAVEKMCDTFSTDTSDIFAGVGPYIHKCCYVVGDEVALLFSEKCSSNERGMKYYLDLGCVVRGEFENARVPLDQVEISDACTSCNSEYFHSYRRDGIKAGRIISIFGVSS
ncbi:peptidoglycan editing factor PgeF [candidate division KSB1 bacterium]